jgi:hypothetical protein
MLIRHRRRYQGKGSDDFIRKLRHKIAPFYDRVNEEGIVL